MHADLSRDTFDPARHFARVVMQQGRPPLDADWNEQSAIHHHYLRRLAADLIGPHGGPRGDLGFGVTLSDTTRTLTIGPGRYYVDGVLVENPRPLEISPSTPLGRRLMERYGDLEPPFAVYLEVWERHVTALQDPRIREVALGGPDTATRVQVAWTVGVRPLKGMENTGDCDAVWDRLTEAERNRAVGGLTAMAGVSGSDTLDPCLVPPDAAYRGLGNQLYRVEIHRGGRTEGPRLVQGGVHGFQQRVPGQGTETVAIEIALKRPTFKWSRENGSVFFAVRSLEGQVAVVETLGPDPRLDLSPGDWVEITDDERAAPGGTGILVQVTDVDRDQLTVILDDRGEELPVYGDDDAGLHPLLRRWDQSQPVSVRRDGHASPSPSELDDGAVVIEPGWIELEDGIRVRFDENAAYQPGEYWLIPARTATGDIEWPRDGAGHPEAVPPRGMGLRRAPLALVLDKGEVGDCRRCFDGIAVPCRMIK